MRTTRPLGNYYIKDFNLYEKGGKKGKFFPKSGEFRELVGGEKKNRLVEYQKR